LNTNKTSHIVAISLSPTAPPSTLLTFTLSYIGFDSIREVGSATLPDGITKVNSQNNVVVQWDIFGTNWPSWTDDSIVQASFTLGFESSESDFASIQVYPPAGSTVTATEAYISIEETPGSAIGSINYFYFPGSSSCSVQDGFSSKTDGGAVLLLPVWAIIVIAIGACILLSCLASCLWCCCCCEI